MPEFSTSAVAKFSARRVIGVRRIAGVLIAATVAASSALAADPIVVPRADFPRTSPPMGANLEGVVDYSRSMVFVDAIKSARKFGSPEGPWDGSAACDEHGWPTGDAGAVVMADVPVMAGDYTFSCTGRCEVGLVNTKGSVKTQAYDRQKNTTTATIAINEGATGFFLSFKNTQGGIKNIRLLRPGYPLTTDQVFGKEFLTAIAPFSVLRLMDFTNTNLTDVAEWKDRPKMDDAIQTSTGGVAWEYGILLANQAKKDLWINVPDRASDDYVRELAKFLKDKLNKDRNVYVEYSNEVWNSTFKQGGRNLEAAKAQVAAGDTKLNDNGKDDNQYYWAWKRVPERLLQISAIFREVWGDAAMNTRVRPVLASQSANIFMARMQVEFIEKNYGPPAKFIYGIAGAPYLGPEEKVSNKDKATVEELINAINVNGWVKECTTQFLALARYYRLHHMCYEGGIAIEGEKNLDAKLLASRHPKIADSVNAYFNLWYGQGGDLFMYYNLAGTWSKYGCWGLTDDIRVATPKSKAVAKVAAAPVPPTTIGAAVPGIIEAWKYDANVGGGVENSQDGGKNLAYLQDGNTFDYLLNIKESGEYLVSFQAAARDESSRLEPLLSGVSLGQVAVPNTQNGQVWAPTAPVHVKLEKGQLVLRVRVAHTGMNIRSISFQKAG